jgi:hypothetical protein
MNVVYTVPEVILAVSAFYCKKRKKLDTDSKIIITLKPWHPILSRYMNNYIEYLNISMINL